MAETRMTGRRLGLVAEAPLAPPDRGRLLTAEQVAAELLPDGSKPRYVRDHIYPRVVLGRRTVFWYERDVLDWLERQRVVEEAS